MKIDWEAYHWARRNTEEASRERATVFAIWYSQFEHTFDYQMYPSDRYADGWATFMVQDVFG